MLLKKLEKSNRKKIRGCFWKYILKKKDKLEILIIIET